LLQVAKEKKLRSLFLPGIGSIRQVTHVIVSADLIKGQRQKNCLKRQGLDIRKS
jgi:hypothetical protein